MKCEECGKSNADYHCTECGGYFCSGCAVSDDYQCECQRNPTIQKIRIDGLKTHFLPLPPNSTTLCGLFIYGKETTTTESEVTCKNCLRSLK